MTESQFFPRNIKPICDICISTPLHIDQALFKFWLKGDTITQMTKRKLETQKELYHKYTQYVMSSQKVSAEVAEKQLEKFVENQLQNTIRNFQLLSRFLSTPEMLRNQTVFSINLENCSQLIHEYYKIESSVIRELLGNRFKQKNRKKTLAEKCGKPAIVCKRVESNFERVFKFASQITEGNVIDLIQHEFLLPLELAQKYERILFICYHKFDISKKRIENFTYKHFDAMVKSMLSWCVVDENSGFDRFQIDKNFSDRLKNIKNILQTKEIIDEMKQAILNNSDSPFTPEKRAKVEPNISKIIAAISNIGANLDQPREFKDFFVDIIEKIRNPLKDKMDLNKKEVEYLFNRLIASFNSSIASRESVSQNQKKKYGAAWQSYISCLLSCIQTIYRINLPP